ncbi:hypothetical protein G9A89_000190, partial [Geosiphon pyriformis]
MSSYMSVVMGGCGGGWGGGGGVVGGGDTDSYGPSVRFSPINRICVRHSTNTVFDGSLTTYVTYQYGPITRINPIVCQLVHMVVCLELMLLSLTVWILASCFEFGDLSGKLLGISSIALAGAESAVGLGIVVALYRLKDGKGSPSQRGGGGGTFDSLNVPTVKGHLTYKSVSPKTLSYIAGPQEAALKDLKDDAVPKGVINKAQMDIYIPLDKWLRQAYSGVSETYTTIMYHAYVDDINSSILKPCWSNPFRPASLYGTLSLWMVDMNFSRLLSLKEGIQIPSLPIRLYCRVVCPTGKIYGGMEGVQLEATTKIFDKFICDLYNMRQKAKSTIRMKPITTMTKIIDSTLYPKIQNVHHIDLITYDCNIRTDAYSQLAMDIENLDTKLDTEIPLNTNVAIAAVTGNARVIMAKLMARYPDQKFCYSDTDSLVCDKPLAHKTIGYYSKTMGTYRLAKYPNGITSQPHKKETLIGETFKRASQDCIQNT